MSKTYLDFKKEELKMKNRLISIINKRNETFITNILKSLNA